jgi:hypothetical protein
VGELGMRLREEEKLLNRIIELAEKLAEGRKGIII